LQAGFNFFFIALRMPYFEKKTLENEKKGLFDVRRKGLFPEKNGRRTVSHRCQTVRIFTPWHTAARARYGRLDRPRSENGTAVGQMSSGGNYDPKAFPQKITQT
jgi:hypothetical protein